MLVEIFHANVDANFCLKNKPTKNFEPNFDETVILGKIFMQISNFGAKFYVILM